MGVRVTAILNLKGGVGKTTTVINMAAILAKDHGRRVLIMDADSQCNTTEFFVGDTTLGNMATILRSAQLHPNPEEYAVGCIQATQFENISLLPGDSSLMDLDLSKVEQGVVNVSMLF